MSIEGENRELLFQELYNMVGYHLAKYDRMPSLSFDDENPKSSDPTKHVVYDENEGKIIIHTGRFKMKREDILEKLRGFECDIDVDGQTEVVKFDFTTESQGNNSIAVGALEGFLTFVGKRLISPERQEKYYAKKKTSIVDRDQEDGNEQLGDLFNKGPNKGPEANSNSVQKIRNKYPDPSVPQQPGSQPVVQQTQDGGWLTGRIPYNYCLQEEGVEKLALGIDPATGQRWQTGEVLGAITNHASKWENIEINGISLRRAAQLGNRGVRPSMINNNFNYNFGNNNGFNQNALQGQGYGFQNNNMNMPFIGNNQFQGNNQGYNNNFNNNGMNQNGMNYGAFQNDFQQNPNNNNQNNIGNMNQGNNIPNYNYLDNQGNNQVNQGYDQGNPYAGNQYQQGPFGNYQQMNPLNINPNLNGNYMPGQAQYGVGGNNFVGPGNNFTG
ncbi:MAG: hypothetical protein IJT14_00290 [Rickettsiales bacterium]|nr:hypothetical protein [Rickettsiales bacterium]